MRLAADDVTRSLRASWRLMSEGPQALAELDLTRDGFWRSFLAFALMLPASIALLAAMRVLAGLSNTAGLFGSTSLVAAVIGMQFLTILAVPAVLLGLAPRLARAPRFTGFVIAWNWAGIVSASLMAVPAAVFAIGWSPVPLAILQALAFGLIVLRLRYCVARATFGTANGIAHMIALTSLLADYSVIRSLGLVAI